MATKTSTKQFIINLKSEEFKSLIGKRFDSSLSAGYDWLGVYAVINRENALLGIADQNGNFYDGTVSRKTDDRFEFEEESNCFRVDTDSIILA